MLTKSTTVLTKLTTIWMLTKSNQLSNDVTHKIKPIFFQNKKQTKTTQFRPKKSNIKTWNNFISILFYFHLPSFLVWSFLVFHSAVCDCDTCLIKNKTDNNQILKSHKKKQKTSNKPCEKNNHAHQIDNGAHTLRCHWFYIPGSGALAAHRESEKSVTLFNDTLL